MKLRKYLCLMLLSIFVCPVAVMASTQGSIREQSIFKDRIFEMLKRQDLNAIKDYVNSIPDCDLSYNKEEEDTSSSDPVCTMDRINGKSFLWHVWQKGYNKESYRFNLIETDAGLYEALGNYYRSLYHVEPRKFDVKLYKDFYNRFINTWLQERVELILTQLWQSGTIYKKWEGFSGMTGKNIYTTLYISNKLGFKNIFRYIDPEVKMDKHVKIGTKSSRLNTILKEMKQTSEETDAPELLPKVVNSWFNSIISPELWDKTEQEYYKGKKQENMYRTLNEEGWDIFADAGLTPDDWQIHTVTLYVRACDRVLGNKEICSAFEAGATKYGFYVPPQKIEEQVEQEVAETVDRTSAKFNKGYLPL